MLLPQYVHWLTAQQRIDIGPPTAIFRHCIGFLDGSVVVLRYKPMVNPEVYFCFPHNCSEFSFTLAPTLPLTM